MAQHLKSALWKQLLQRSARDNMSLQGQIREMLVAAILDGQLPAGVPIPSQARANPAIGGAGPYPSQPQGRRLTRIGRVMTEKHDPQHKAPSTDRMPPVIYAALAGFVLWLVVASWGFVGPGYAELSLAVISVYFFILMAIPFTLWCVWRASREPENPPEPRKPFADWANGEFEIWQDHRKGRSAAIEIVLPIAAAAIGMTAFAIVFHHAALHAPAAHAAVATVAST